MNIICPERKWIQDQDSRPRTVNPQYEESVCGTIDTILHCTALNPLRTNCCCCLHRLNLPIPQGPAEPFEVSAPVDVHALRQDLGLHETVNLFSRHILQLSQLRNRKNKRKKEKIRQGKGSVSITKKEMVEEENKCKKKKYAKKEVDKRSVKKRNKASNSPFVAVSVTWKT